MQLKRSIRMLTLLLFLILILSGSVFAQITIGVKKGDWIEYNVSYTGAPSVGHDLTWAKLEVMDVQANNIMINITSRYSNDTTEYFASTLNLANGHMIDDFIIPANLKSDDKFYDENYGNLTITKVEQHDYAGATRTVVQTTIGNSTYIWDQATGVSVEGNSQTTDYSMHTIVAATNMWQPSTGLNGLIIGLLVAIMAIVIAIFLVIAYTRRKQKLTKIS